MTSIYTDFSTLLILRIYITTIHSVTNPHRRFLCSDNFHVSSAKTTKRKENIFHAWNPKHSFGIDNELRNSVIFSICFKFEFFGLLLLPLSSSKETLQLDANANSFAAFIREASLGRGGTQRRGCNPSVKWHQQRGLVWCHVDQQLFFQDPENQSQPPAHCASSKMQTLSWHFWQNSRQNTVQKKDGWADRLAPCSRT